MSQEIWMTSEAIAWGQILLDNYQLRLGKELIQRNGNTLEEAKALFLAPFVVVSHGTEDNPIFNYGNQVALNLWEMTWEEFTATPSRQPVEPMEREEREAMLQQVTEHGFINNYRGVRTSSSGRRFWIEDVTVWNLVDSQNRYCGQSATFGKWVFLTEV